MQLTFDIKELSLVESWPLPENTWLVKKDGENTLATYSVKAGRWELDKDFVEDAKEFTDEEAIAYSELLTKESVLKFFISNRNEDRPYRLYEANCDKEYEFFKFINHAGEHTHDKDYNWLYNIFSIRISKNSNLVKAEKEIREVLVALAQESPAIKEFRLNILEHTFSEDGSYKVKWIVDSDSFVVNKYFYGTPTEKRRFILLQDCLKYIQEFYWYE